MKGFTTLLCLLLSSVYIWSQAYVPGVVLVQLKPQTDLPKFLEAHQAAAGQLASLRVEKAISEELQIWRLRFDHDAIDEAVLLRTLRENPRVLIAQFDHYVSKRGSWPEDPLFYQQWALHNDGSAGGTPGVDVGSLAAWDITTGGVTPTGDTIVIAMIDDGVDIYHPDLQGNLWLNHDEIPGNGIDDDGNGYIDDYRGWNVSAGVDLIQYGMHGTQVAGVLAARGNNQTGLSSLNWTIKLMTVAGIGNLESQILEGYNYVLQQRLRYQQTGGQEGAFVVAVNTSWGIDGGQASNAPLWCQFYDILGQAGILSVAAVANQDWNIDQHGDLPGTCSSPYLITVTATDKHDHRGQAAWGPVHVDLAAPGVQVLSTYHGGSYAEVSGTSFAAPMVSSLAALLYSAPCSYLPELAMVDPEAATSLMRDLLLQSTKPIPALQSEILSGGRIQADQALSELLSLCETCLLPAALSSEVTGNQTLLLWQELSGAEVLELQWKELGALTWHSQLFPSSPYLLDELPPCTAHEFRLGVWCDETQATLYTQSVPFYSHDCCLPPEVWSVQAVSNNSLAISIPNEPQASYLVRYRPVDQVLWHTQLVELGGACVVPNLQPCTWYELQISRQCPGQAEFFSERVLIQTQGCGGCTDQSYCASGGATAQFEWIQSVNLNDVILASGSDMGYGNHTGRPFTLNLDSVHHLMVTPGFSYSAYPQYYRVWIDLNQDGELQHPDELILDSDGSTSAPFACSFSLPAHTMPGMTRMRISMKWVQGIMSAPLPCELYYFGETEDYCVNILSTVLDTPCPQPSPPVLAWVGSEEVSLSNSTSEFKPKQIRYRKIHEIAWKYIPISRLPYRLEHLSPCEVYEIQIQASCENASPFSGSLLFSTQCFDSETPETPFVGTENPGDAQLFPNPWSSGELLLHLYEPTEMPYQLTWLNTQGQRLREEKLDVAADQTQYALRIPEEWSSGVYILIITVEGQEPQVLKLAIAR